MRKRLEYIDKAKGILISLMVIGHIWQSGFVFQAIYAFHMPAFFAISGILMAYTESYRKPYLKYVKSRIFAYGIPFLFIELLGCLTDIVRNGVTLNWKGYLYNTLTFNFNDPNLWFLVNLFLIELLVTVLLKMRTGEKMLCGIAAVLFAVRYVLPTEVMYVSTITSAFKYFTCFVIGFVGRDLMQKDNTTALVIAASIVLGYAILGGRITLQIVRDIAYLVSGLSGTYVVLQIALRKWTHSLERFLVAAGKNTLIIYGTHHFYYATLGVLLSVQDFASTPILTGLIILFAVMLLEIPTIYVINQCFPFLAGKQSKKTTELLREASI